MKNQKGFTLIEVLVVITILALIMLITFPAVSKLQKQNQYKKFDEYRDTILTAAKLYANQKKDDLYAPGWDGCVSVSVKDVLEAAKIEQDDEEFTCSGSNTGGTVIIKRTNQGYSYGVEMTCKFKKKEGEKEYKFGDQFTFTENATNIKGCWKAQANGLDNYFAKLCSGNQTCDLKSSGTSIQVGEITMRMLSYDKGKLTVLSPTNLVSVPYTMINNKEFKQVLFERVKQLYVPLQVIDIAFLTPALYQGLEEDQNYFALTGGKLVFGKELKTISNLEIVPLRFTITFKMERANFIEGDIYHVLDSNSQKLSAGTKLKDVPVGRLLNLSGVAYRVIGQDEQGTKVMSTVNLASGVRLRANDMVDKTDYTKNPSTNPEEPLPNTVLYQLEAWYQTLPNELKNHIIKAEFKGTRLGSSLNPYQSFAKTNTITTHVFLPSLGDLFVTSLDLLDAGNAYWTSTIIYQNQDYNYYVGSTIKGDKNYQSPNNVTSNQFDIIDAEGNVTTPATKLGIRPVFYLNRDLTLKEEGTGISIPLELNLS